MINKLSPGAAEIFKKVTEALQNAEELGGVSSHNDYRNLMEKIIGVCHERKMNSYDAKAIEDAARG